MLFGDDRLTGCLVTNGMMISTEALLTKQYTTMAAAIDTPCTGHTKWPNVPPRARYTTPAACTAAVTVRPVSANRRDACSLCEPATLSVTVPAMATSIAAPGPRSNSEVKSTTKVSGMTAQSSVVDRRLAMADVRIAARISPENSKIRCACANSIRCSTGVERAMPGPHGPSCN